MSSTQHRDSQQHSGASSITSSHSHSAYHLPLRDGQSLKHQRGMGMLSIFCIIAVALFIGMFAFKVAPHYMENWTVSKIASDVASNPELLQQPRSKVYSYIQQAYGMNNLWELKPEETIKLKKNGNKGYVVTVQYEKRDTLISNIDVVTSFDTEVSPSR